MIVEIRTYRLKPGTGDEFVRVMREKARPLLAEFGIDVVDCGRSLVAEDGAEEAYLIRAFPSLGARVEQEERFYRSEEWRTGPREAVLSRIETYHTVVLDVPDEAVPMLRH